jgi:cytochrome P450
MASNIPPGPNDYFFGMRTMSRMKADVLGIYVGFQRDYGDSVSFRTGPYRLFIFYHPDQVREVLVTHAKTLIRLPHVMKTFAQWNGNSVLMAEGEQWIRQRRMVQAAFQPRRLDNYGRTMVGSARKLVESWREAIDRDGYIDVDIDKAMTGLTLSIICKTMFDREVEDVSDDISEAVSVLSIVAYYEMQAAVRFPLWIPMSWNRKKRWALNVLDNAVWQFVRERRADGSDHGDLLSMLLAAVDEESGGTRMNDRQVRDEAMALMLAGHDTTAAGMDWVWYNIARFPEVARRCQEEIDAVVGDREPLASDIDQLPYLVATIKESLRLYPPAIGIFLRQTTCDLVIGGFDVPKGSLISLSSYVTHRDPRWFTDPERFDPARFLPNRADEIQNGAYFPFGAGPRVCIGQSFAMTEMVLVAASMLQACDVESVPGRADPTMQVTMALRPKEQLLIRWKLRED